MVASSITPLWLFEPAIRLDAPPIPVDITTVFGLDAAVVALESHVCAFGTELLVDE